MCCLYTTDLEPMVFRTQKCFMDIKFHELSGFSGNSFIAESKLFNENGKEVAFGTGSFLNSKIPLNQIDDFKY